MPRVPATLDPEAAEKKRLAAEKRAAKAAESKRIAAEKKAAKQAQQAAKKRKRAEEKAAKQAVKEEEKLRKEAEKAEKKRKAAEGQAAGGGELQVPGTGAGEEDGDVEGEPSPKKPKSTYMPREGTLAEAYLIILLQRERVNMRAPTKHELMTAVDKSSLTSSAVFNTGEGSFFDGWSSFIGLRKRTPGLVETVGRGPMHCYLTPEGRETAETLCIRAADSHRIPE